MGTCHLFQTWIKSEVSFAAHYTDTAKRKDDHFWEDYYMLCDFHLHESVNCGYLIKRKKHTQTWANFEMTASLVLEWPRAGNRKPTLTSRVRRVVRNTVCWEIIYPYVNLAVNAAETSVCYPRYGTCVSFRRAERH